MTCWSAFAACDPAPVRTVVHRARSEVSSRDRFARRGSAPARTRAANALGLGRHQVRRVLKEEGTLRVKGRRLTGTR